MSAPVKPIELAEAEALVRKHMGFAGLRAGQAETIVRTLRGEDVLSIMPTGGGKSICYQLPAVLESGITVVVSPLIALMKDQLDSLPAPMRAVATSLTSESSAAEARSRLAEVAKGRYRLVYVAPERLRQPSLLHALRAAGVKRLVVDEAHCVSVWGHDFRPDFLNIPKARIAMGNPPVLAMTATAPPRVADDIDARLGPLTRVTASIERPNLRFEAIVARDADEKLAHLAALCRDTPGPGVVYANSRAKCEQLAEALRRVGINAASYHAGLPHRHERQEEFMRGAIDVLVATVAFGMGIDKGDIRFVFHHDPPGSLENYYQEAGRAGRDGEPARCVLLATAQDAGLMKSRAKRDLPDAGLVERAWALVLTTATDDGQALVDLDAVRALEPHDEVRPRVALAFLEESGAIERLGEVPRFLRILDRVNGFAGTGQESSVFDVATALGVPPEATEDALLERGIRFGVSQRATLFRVLGAPEHVEDIMARHLEQLRQRADEVMAYVKTPRCRHAHLRFHFGEKANPRCAACDNCLKIQHAPATLDMGSEQDAARAVIDALLAVRGIGETNLVFLLRGDARTPEWALDNPAFGALAFRSEAKVKAAIRTLESGGFVSRETLSHGGVSLRASETAATARDTDAALPVAASPAAPRPARNASSSAASEDADLDAAGLARFEALRMWRRARADADGVPPYVVAHDATLRAIAAAAPASSTELLGVKGMGPKRVEKYGDEILASISGGP